MFVGIVNCITVRKGKQFKIAFLFLLTQHFPLLGVCGAFGPLTPSARWARIHVGVFGQNTCCDSCPTFIDAFKKAAQKSGEAWGGGLRGAIFDLKNFIAILVLV